MFDIALPPVPALMLGLIFLGVGGDLLIRGAVRIAQRLGLSPLVIGLTLVGFGTSTPELVTSVQAGLSYAPGVAYGNIIGSNIANILLIGGLSALLFPIAIDRVALRRDASTMLGAAVVFWALALTMPLGRAVGIALILGLIVYLAWVLRTERAGTSASADDTAPSPKAPLAPPILLTLAGLGLVILGGATLVRGAVTLAQNAGVSETFIGLTIVAIGTSLPELVTSVMAALRRQGDVAFGNIVGSNIYNVLGIGGATALIAPAPIPADIIRFDLPVMILASMTLIALAAYRARMSRHAGAALLLGYAAYTYAIWP